MKEGVVRTELINPDVNPHICILADTFTNRDVKACNTGK